MKISELEKEEVTIREVEQALLTRCNASSLMRESRLFTALFIRKKSFSTKMVSVFFWVSGLMGMYCRAC